MAGKTCFQILAEAEMAATAKVYGVDDYDFTRIAWIMSFFDSYDRRCAIFACLGIAPMLMTEDIEI
jgi:hypothetical protein